MSCGVHNPSSRRSALYQRLHPRFKAICAEGRVPYTSRSVVPCLLRTRRRWACRRSRPREDQSFGRGPSRGSAGEVDDDAVDVDQSREPLRNLGCLLQIIGFVPETWGLSSRPLFSRLAHHSDQASCNRAISSQCSVVLCAALFRPACAQ